MSTTTMKRSRAEALKDAEALRAMFPADCYERWEFAGSLRRGRPEVGDVEHVIIPRAGQVRGDDLFAEPQTVNLLFHHLDALVKGGEVTKHIYGTTGFRWGEKYRGVDYRGFNHELFCADADNFGCIYTIRTGPAEFSQRLVTMMKQRGMYRQQDGYVITQRDGQRVRGGGGEGVSVQSRVNVFGQVGFVEIVNL